MGFLGLGGSDSSAALIGGCYSAGEVPGRSVVRALGLVEFTQKGIAGDAPKVSPSIFRSLLDAAKESGANAVINVRLSTGTYQQQGSQWQVTYIIAYGDAVVLSE
jgi:hypothetical protein